MFSPATQDVCVHGALLTYLVLNVKSMHAPNTLPFMSIPYPPIEQQDSNSTLRPGTESMKLLSSQLVRLEVIVRDDSISTLRLGSEQNMDV